jgi:hypothetical protein
MKKIILSVTLIATLSVACKTKEKATASAASTTQTAVENNAAPKTTGKVSHQYRATGCATVVIVKIEGEENPATLIPKDKLPENLDVDGKEIMFDYRPLRMPNPQGCNVGMPAELTNIKSK